jgi:hypothetical protein
MGYAPLVVDDPAVDFENALRQGDAALDGWHVHRRQIPIGEERVSLAELGP